MRKLIQLKAKAVQAGQEEFRRCASLVHHEVAPGVFCHIGLGATGLQLICGEAIVGVGLDELVKLARIAAPAFARPSRALKKKGFR